MSSAAAGMVFFFFPLIFHVHLETFLATERGVHFRKDAWEIVFLMVAVAPAQGSAPMQVGVLSTQQGSIPAILDGSGGGGQRHGKRRPLITLSVTHRHLPGHRCAADRWPSWLKVWMCLFAP